MGYPALQARRFGAGSPFNWPVAIGYERAPFSSYPGSCVAGPNGVAIGIFAWVNEAGQVSNVQSAEAQLCFVIPVINAYIWQRVYPSYPSTFVNPCTGEPYNVSGYPTDPYDNQSPWPLRVIRSGNEVIAASLGTFNTRFVAGGQVGSQVWTDPGTGLAYASQADPSYIATPWTLMQSGAAGAVLRIQSLTAPLS